MNRKESAYYTLYQPSSNNCAAVVSYMAGYFKNNGKYYTKIKDLEIGDVVFFQNSQGLSHVGYCVDWSDSNKTFTTIEGNKDNKVATGVYRYSEVGGYVAGFGKPRYTNEITRKASLEYIKSQLGYTEGPNNWNKYADELDKVDYFAGCGKKQNLPWCAVFICAAMYNAYNAEPVAEPAPAPAPSQDPEPTPEPKPEPKPGPTPAPEPSTEATHTVRVNTYLNVRTGPGTNFAVVGKLHNGDKVTVTKTLNGWGCIENGRWVSLNYLAPIASADSYKVKTNSGAPLALRAAASKSSTCFVWIPNGTALKVDKIVDGWAHTSYGGYTGYCSTAYLTKA